MGMMSLQMTQENIDLTIILLPSVCNCESDVTAVGN